MLQIGYHQSTITPKVDLPMEGYEHRFIYDGLPTGVRDELMCKVLSITDGHKEALLITLDLCVLTDEQVEKIQDTLCECFGLERAYILIFVSHTHSGPITTNPWTEISENKSVSSIHTSYTDNIRRYLEQLEKTIIRTTGYARTKRTTVDCYFTTARTTLGFNRRGKRSDGSIENCFSLWEPRDCELTGTVEDRVPVIIFERVASPQQDTYLEPFNVKRVILFSAAWHPVVLGKHSTLISADYPGEACKTIEETLGEGTRAMFTLGACGDTEPYLATNENPKSCEIIGKALGYTITAACALRTPVKTDRLAASMTVLRNRHENDRPVRLHALRLGEVSIVTAGAECFSQSSLDLYDKTESDQLLYATNTNGWAGYLPTERAYEEGGYEVAAGRDRVDPKRLSKVTQLLIELAEHTRGE